MKDEIIAEEMEFMTVDEADLPDIISKQMILMADLEEKMNKALEKADEAKNSAESARKKSAGAFKKKEAIEALQSASVELAEAQSSSIDAQQISFEYQRQMTEITKYLFGLGCTNISINRAIIQGLRDGIDGKEAEKFGDLAKEHMLTLIKQLKAQEDIQNKTENLSTYIREQGSRLDSQETIIEKQIQKDQEHDVKFIENKVQDEKHDQAISSLQREVVEIREELKNQNRSPKLMYVSIVLSIIAIIVSIVSMFI